MKPFRVVLSLFCVLLSLVLIFAFFPAEGLPVPFKVPDVAEVFQIEKFSALLTPEPEELETTTAVDTLFLLSQEEDAEDEEEKRKYLCRLQELGETMILPEGNPEFFDSLFASFDSASKKRVRVAYYGDSQLEEDRMSITLRDSLQRCFGGCGVGLLPASLQYQTLSICQSKNYSPASSNYFHEKNFYVADGRYGPCLTAHRIFSPYTVRFYRNPKLQGNHTCGFFKSITVLADSTARISWTSDSLASFVVDSSTIMRRHRINLPKALSEVRMTVSGSGNLLGIMLDDETGVCVDNFAIRGSSGTFFEHLNKEQLKDYLVGDNVRLVILQYGANQMPALRGAKSQSEYGKTMYRQIMAIRELAPDAAVLFCGPQDMSSYGFVSSVADTLKRYATLAGAAYWDMCGVMGGHGKMAEWKRQGLASSDGIHFSRSGAEKMSAELFNSINAYYQYYKWRKRD